MPYQPFNLDPTLKQVGTQEHDPRHSQEASYDFVVAILAQCQVLDSSSRQAKHLGPNPNQPGSFSISNLFYQDDGDGISLLSLTQYGTIGARTVLLLRQLDPGEQKHKSQLPYQLGTCRCLICSQVHGARSKTVVQLKVSVNHMFLYHSQYVFSLAPQALVGIKTNLIQTQESQPVDGSLGADHSSYLYLLQESHCLYFHALGSSLLTTSLSIPCSCVSSLAWSNGF